MKGVKRQNIAKLNSSRSGFIFYANIFFVVLQHNPICFSLGHSHEMFRFLSPYRTTVHLKKLKKAINFRDTFSSQCKFHIQLN